MTITSYSSGDAKWYFTDVPVERGTYTYATAYKATRTSFLVVRFQHQDGSFTYRDLGLAPASDVFVQTSAQFWVSSTVKSVTVFQLIKGVGELTIDDVSLTLTEAPKGIFTTGGVTLTFDDGWLSQRDNAVPKMNAAGLKATFYIVSKRFGEDGFPLLCLPVWLVRLDHAAGDPGCRLHQRAHDHERASLPHP